MSDLELSGLIGKVAVGASLALGSATTALFASYWRRFKSFCTKEQMEEFVAKELKEHNKTLQLAQKDFLRELELRLVKCSLTDDYLKESLVRLEKVFNDRLDNINQRLTQMTEHLIRK